jgi:hypothetical protein
VVRATVKLAAASLKNHYQVDEQDQRAPVDHPRTDETWVMWTSNKYVVKVGGGARTCRACREYADRYPSDLPGGALESTSGGPRQRAEEERAQTPTIRSEPDFDKYDPEKVKVIPEKKVDNETNDDEDDAAPKKKDPRRTTRRRRRRTRKSDGDD